MVHLFLTFLHNYNWCHSVYQQSRDWVWWAIKKNKKKKQVSLTLLLWFRTGECTALGQDECNMDVLHLHRWLIKKRKMKVWCQSAPRKSDRLLLYLYHDTTLITSPLFFSILSCRLIQRLHSLAELSPRWVQLSPLVKLCVHCLQQVSVCWVF